MEEGDYIKRNENIEKTLFLLLEPEETDFAILQRFVAVSYTHLDVYKRQSRRLLYGPYGWTIPDQSSRS